MQAMAQMGYQEQMPAAALFPVQKEKKSNCTPHRPKARFHVRYYDFIEICQGDGACADVLRYFEMQTDWLIDQLCKAYRMAEGYIPDPDDLWIAASYRDVSEGICRTQSHTTCGDRIEDLIELGFLERRFIARATAEVESRPAATFYEDQGGVFIVVEDRWGNYIDSNGVPQNAVDGGYEEAEWQYRYCIDTVNKALAGPFLEPPEPAKLWPPIVKRRDPVPQKGNGVTTPTDCDPRNVDDASDEPISSQASDQGGTSNAEDCKESGHFHNTVDTKVLSTIRRDISTNVLKLSGNSQETENFTEAPWSPETLIGLAQGRVRPGLFECTGDDADYEGAERLMRETAALGLSPQFAWTAIDRHICAMMDGPTWYARRRGKKLAFTLDHVARNWHTVEDELKKEPWSPLDPVPYVGPSLDHEEEYTAGYEDQQDSPSIDEPPVIIEGSLEMPETPIEEYDVQGDDDPPGDEENTMHILPPPTQQWPPSKRGMDQIDFDNLCAEIWRQYPSLSLASRELNDGSLAVGIEYRPNQWMPVCNAQQWHRPNPTLQRAIQDAVRYSEMRRDP